VAGAELRSDPPAPIGSSQRSSAEFDAGDVALETVLAKGVKDGQTCQFGNLEVSQNAGGLRTNWAVIRIDDSCEVSVAARWRGSLSDRPAAILPELEDSETHTKSFTETVEVRRGDDRGKDTSQAVMAASSCSTHKQQIIHYGFGGPLDVLTKLIGTMVACENATTFTSVSHTGSCVATNPPGGWTWVVERCYSGGVIATSTTAQTIEKGDFHCSPRASFPCNAVNPDGYDHTLRTVEQKARGGGALCFVSLTGLDVVASYKDIIQGCS
ncbi:MAG TPA: hypothetical protein VLS86_03695, partial [Acidimicrobiia bacterium]|nr:hypothetical protein [Acidimicrobiia bacterium]